MIKVPLNQFKVKPIALQGRALRRFVLTSAAIGLVLALCGHVISGSEPDRKMQDGKVDLRIELQGDAIRIELANRSEDDYTAVLPMLLSPPGSAAGLEYQIVDSRGERANLCGLVNPVSAPKPTILKAGVVYVELERVDLLARIYCLSSYEYKLRVVFHNAWNGKEISAPLKSNLITIKWSGSIGSQDQ